MKHNERIYQCGTGTPQKGESRKSPVINVISSSTRYLEMTINERIEVREPVALDMFKF